MPGGFLTGLRHLSMPAHVALNLAGELPIITAALLIVARLIVARPVAINPMISPPIFASRLLFASLMLIVAMFLAPVVAIIRAVEPWNFYPDL
jgi:hypothetical protein